MIMTPWEDLFYVINNLLLGEEPSIEDFILLIGTSVAFVAFVLWCCFPIEPKDSLSGEQLSTQAADAVYDAKYKQLPTVAGCRKSAGVQDIMQYDINT